jgi:7-cyano-7-deazaguanine synthase
MSCVVLFSGGLDSTVLLALAKQAHTSCLALSFNYGQRHQAELSAASKIASYFGVEHKVISIDTGAFGASSLLLSDQGSVPKGRTVEEIQRGGVPTTYVPARNTLFLAHAISHAELIGAEGIYIGANAADAHCYPDCREEYFSAVQELIKVATKQGASGQAPKLHTPFLFWDKKRIIQEGSALGCPFQLSLSCYDPGPSGTHCGSCDACRLRREGFLAAGAKDPTAYGIT